LSTDSFWKLERRKKTASPIGGGPGREGLSKRDDRKGGGSGADEKKRPKKSPSAFFNGGEEKQTPKCPWKRPSNKSRTKSREPKREKGRGGTIRKADGEKASAGDGDFARAKYNTPIMKKKFKDRDYQKRKLSYLCSNRTKNASGGEGGRGAS